MAPLMAGESRHSGRTRQGAKGPTRLGSREGLDERVRAVLPTSAGTIIGGRFRTVAGIAVNGIAIRGGSGWQALGNGLTNGVGEVAAVALLPNGDIVAGGSFSVANGAPATAVARWNGSTWTQLGNGLVGGAHALAVLPNGDLIAGGSLAPVGATSHRNIVRWNGSTWTHVASGVNNTVEALAVTPNGDLIAGGWFQQVGPGNTPASRIARFAGGAWHAMGTGLNGTVRGLAIQPDGAIVACGAFDTAGGVPTDDLARWIGTSWQALPSGLVPSGLRAVAALPNGDLVVGSEHLEVAFPTYAVPDRAARLRGTTWTAMGVGRDVFSTSVDAVFAFALAPDGGLYVGGSFHRVASLVSANLARLDTTCPAAAAPYGIGCTGAGGLEQLQATVLPWLGTTFRARATGLPGLCFAMSVYGFAPAALPLAAALPQGLPGCTLLATPDSVEPLIANAGTVDTQLPVPANLALLGVTLRHQVVALAVDPSLNITSISAGNGLLLTIGAL